MRARKRHTDQQFLTAELHVKLDKVKTSKSISNLWDLRYNESFKTSVTLEIS